jgi:hypothetical protein
MDMGKKILLINPWIHDFAAYDFWLKPLGLLYLGGLLRQNGHQIHFIDCQQLILHVSSYTRQSQP